MKHSLKRNKSIRSLLANQSKKSAMQTIGVEGGLKLPQKLFKSVNSRVAPRSKAERLKDDRNDEYKIRYEAGEEKTTTVKSEIQLEEHCKHCWFKFAIRPTTADVRAFEQFNQEPCHRYLAAAPTHLSHLGSLVP